MIVTLATITIAIFIIVGGFFALDELKNCYKQKIKDGKMEVNKGGKKTITMMINGFGFLQ